MAYPSTLLNILDNPIVKSALDRSKPLEPNLEAVLKINEPHLDNRHPSPGIYIDDEGEHVTSTTLDFYTFFRAAMAKGAYAIFETYSTNRPVTLQRDVHVKSKENRQGPVFRLASHKESHSWSIGIIDSQTEQFDGEKWHDGSARLFTIVDDSGKFFSGWDSFELVFNQEIRDFLIANKIYGPNGEVKTRYFTHPNRKNSIYGSSYISARVAAERINDEAKANRRLVKFIEDLGIRAAPLQILQYTSNGTYAREKDNTKAKVDKVKKGKVWNLETELKMPEFSGNYPLLGQNENGEIQRYDASILKKIPSKELSDILRYAKTRANYLTYTLGPEIRTITRAAEFAFAMYGFCDERLPGNESYPPWETLKWQEYKPTPRSKPRQILAIGGNNGDLLALTYRFVPHTVDLKKSGLIGPFAISL